VSAGQQPIRERIESQLASLGKKQRVVADYILANPTAVLFSSAVEVAEHVSVDPATVVRLAQRLGFAGYPEFRDHLRRENTLSFPLVERLVNSVSISGDKAISVLQQQVRAQTMENVERTFDNLDWRAVDNVLTYVLDAKRVVVVGAGVSRVLAMHLARVLQTAQIAVQVLEDWYDLLFEAANFGSGDVLFAITAQRYSRVTIESMRIAREAGARTILLTDGTYAPGVSIADVVLLFSPQSIAEFVSPVAGSAVIDCLAAGLGSRATERVSQSLAIHVQLAIDHELSYW